MKMLINRLLLALATIALLAPTQPTYAEGKSAKPVAKSRKQLLAEHGGKAAITDSHITIGNKFPIQPACSSLDTLCHQIQDARASAVAELGYKNQEKQKALAASGQPIRIYGVRKWVNGKVVNGKLGEGHWVSGKIREGKFVPNREYK